MNKIKKPNLIIAGVNKAGTTSLFMYLSAHPQICPSRIKETQFFLPIRYGHEPRAPFEDYWNQFYQCTDEEYILESTAGYFYGGAPLAQAIVDTLGRIKIIIMIREPIERMFSFFKFRKSMLETEKSLLFSDYLDMCESLPPEERIKQENNLYWGIEGGFYSKYLSDWFEIFGEEQIKIIFFENFIADPKSQLIDLCIWLDLEYQEFINNFEATIENKTQNYKNRFIQNIALQINWKGESFWRSHPRIKQSLRRLYYFFNAAENIDTIDEDSRSRLELIFRPYNRELARELIKRGYSNLPGWLAKASGQIPSEQPFSELIHNTFGE